jgi:hypothetical protein
MNPTTIITSAVVTIVVISGCATYREPSLNSNYDAADNKDVAYISRSAPRVGWKENWYSRDEEILLATVDGAEVVHFYSLFKTARKDPVSLIPGQHYIEIKFKKIWGGGHFWWSIIRLFELNAEPGHYYFPQATERCGKTWFWIYDQGPADKAPKLVAGEIAPASCDDKSE